MKHPFRRITILYNLFSILSYASAENHAVSNLRGSSKINGYWISYGCGVNGKDTGSFSSFRLGVCLKSAEGSTIYRFLNTDQDEVNLDGKSFLVEKVRKSDFLSDDCTGNAIVTEEVLPSSCSADARASGFTSYGVYSYNIPPPVTAGTIIRQFTSADCTGIAAMQSFDTPNSCKAGSTGVRYSCAHKDVVLNLFPSRECLGNADSFVLAQTGDCVKMGSAYFTFECVE